MKVPRDVSTVHRFASVSNTALLTGLSNRMRSRMPNSAATERRYVCSVSLLSRQRGVTSGLKLNEYLTTSESQRAPCQRCVFQTPPRSVLASSIV